VIFDNIPEQPQRKRHRAMDDMVNLVKTKCCEKDCMKAFPEKDMEDCSLKFKQMNQTEQINWLFEFFKVHTSLQPGKNDHFVTYEIQYFEK
jgi:hypothetical protein